MTRLKSVRCCAEEPSKEILRLLDLFLSFSFSLFLDLFGEIQQSGTGMP